MPATARLMADSAAALYVLGGALVLLSVPVAGVAGGRIWLVAVAWIAVGTGVGLHLLADRLPLVVYHVLTGFAAVLITVAVIVGGDTSLAYGFFYVWIAAWAFYWLSTRAAWTSMGWMAVVSAVALLISPTLSAKPILVATTYWLIMVVTACSTGVLLAYLLGRLAGERDQLSWRRQQLNDIMSGLPLSVFALDRTGSVLLVEGHALDRVETNPVSYVGRSIFELLPPENPMTDAARRALAGEDGFGTLRTPTAELEYRMTHIRDEAGAVSGVSGALNDVTEPRRLERAEIERNAREMFMAKVSHELRTPLNAVLGYLQLLGAGESELSQKQRSYVDGMSRAAQLQLALVNDLLDLQKLRAGEMRFSIGPTSVRRLIEEAVDLATPPATRRGVRLRVETLDRELKTDQRQVSQALLNLLSNSIKFSPPGEEVAIRARMAGEAAGCIEVADHGPGLAEDDQARVFGSSTRRRRAGMRPRGPVSAWPSAARLCGRWAATSRSSPGPGKARPSRSSCRRSQAPSADAAAASRSWRSSATSTGFCSTATTPRARACSAISREYVPEHSTIGIAGSGSRSRSL